MWFALIWEEKNTFNTQQRNNYKVNMFALLKQS